jgi:YD repeat-containing protein
MLRKIYSLGLLGVLLLACLGFAVGFSVSYGLIQKSSGATKPNAAIASPGSDKEQDGLNGPVNRVRTETSKLSFKSGKLVEGPRELLELTAYDREGQRIDNSYYLVAVNSQVGEEEYEYDDKGNVGAMTLRGSNKEILRKEVYTYEYDALGNWVKMVISNLVYEEGKLTEQPTEVAYRNITYYFDQAIADIVNSHSSIKEGSTSGQNAQGDFASLRGAFDRWLAATNARDLENLLKFYSPRMDAFYRARNVSQDVVRADRTRLFQLAEAIEVKADAPEITMSGDGRAATMNFSKSYLMRANGRTRQGRVIQQLRWVLTEEGWKIVSERDIKVLSRS